MTDEQREAETQQQQDYQEDNQAPQGEEQSTEGGGELDYESLKQKYEEEKKQRQGLVDKVNKMKEAIKEEQNNQQGQAVSNLSEERLDKIELKQVDPNLTSEQVDEVLTIKKAKGLQDVSDAYNHPMIQSYLKEVREKEEKKGKTEQATPKTQPGNTSVGNESPRLGNQSKNWNESLPGDSTEEMAKVLKQRFFGN